MERRVLVISAEDLKSIVGTFEGYQPLDRSVIAAIEAKSLWMVKDAAEKNPDYKQLIPYHVIRCKDGSIFTYRRATEDDDYPEKRLQGMHSIGIGGHIDQKDGINVKKAASREVVEEVKHKGFVTNVTFMGGINMNDTEVNSVHFGLLYVVDISSNEVKPNDKEIAWGEPMTIDGIHQLFNEEGVEVEGWTETILPHIR